MIGKAGAKVPAKISIDSGVVDIFVSGNGQTIKYSGKGTETDVGTRLPSPTKGMSIPESGGGASVDRPEVITVKSKTKTVASEPEDKSEEQVTDKVYEYLDEDPSWLRGISVGKPAIKSRAKQKSKKSRKQRSRSEPLDAQLASMSNWP